MTKEYGSSEDVLSETVYGFGTKENNLKKNSVALKQVDIYPVTHSSSKMRTKYI